MREIDIIMRPELKSGARKASEASCTLLMWGVFVYFSFPLAEAIVLLFIGAGRETYPLLVSQLLIFIRILLCVATALVVISMWSYYNWLTFGRNDRRRKVSLNFSYREERKSSENALRLRYRKEVRLP